MDKVIESNQAKLSGVIDSEFGYSHEVFGENFYKSYLRVERLSGVVDTIPFEVSGRLIGTTEGWEGKRVRIEGQVRTYNKHENEKNRLIISIFVREIEEISDGDDENVILLDGFVCKEPKYRTTPLGREITDVLLAVNRLYGKSDYIPTEFWGCNARYVSSFPTGTHLYVKGRMQSREYDKKLPDGSIEVRTAYEVSASYLEERD
ncbi:MAG: single-stranded DNA-binding protein [Lachnospiraceae bacterium]|nr:single-stranded DNA-binding protein [Lachnospiraceae bacterium]